MKWPILSHRNMRTTARAVLAMLFSACALQPVLAKTTSLSVTSTVMEQSEIQELAQLQFGTISRPTQQSRIRINENTGVLTVLNGNAVSLGGTISRGHFRLNATPLALILVKTPTGFITLSNGSGGTMRLDQFRKDVGNINIVLLGGTFDWHIGGRLTVGANQAPGHYSGTYDVQVNYF